MMLSLTSVYQLHAFLSDIGGAPVKDIVSAGEVFQHDKDPFFSSVLSALGFEWN